ncbi:EKC/KEOPS complex subunit GON7 isoform X2 [Hylobates moloch]|uniref:EKC/KEOPS complex subunit GON7 isoform X2 n=1 Tax=Hylobates moloch TaxID=81572 RepID=UPI0026752B20|nr:EKC/KEOPS complex subunit GON7 isoform X2 [Hylobates moloch]
MELLGEYVGQEGKPQKLRVSCEAPGDGDPFQGLLSGVAQMKDLVTELFDPLVQGEVQHRVAAAPDEALDVSNAYYYVPNPELSPGGRMNEVNATQFLPL